MKVLVNGGLNLSELDGWWAEAWSPEVGWKLGDGREHDSDPAWDAAEADALYSLLENEVVPEFYTRDEHGTPKGWVARIRESMARLTPEFSANRTVRQYAEEYYLPAAREFRARTARGGALAKEIVQWRERIAKAWPNVRFGRVSVAGRRVEVTLATGGLDPAAIRVELYADPWNGGTPVRLPMEPAGRTEGDALIYIAVVPGDRPVEDYTARAIPAHAAASVPLEAGWIAWQR